MTAWTPPVHVSTGTASSADFNAQVLDNLSYLKSSILQAATAAGGPSTTSTSYVTLSGGPAVTITTGSSALVIVGTEMGIKGYMSFAISGATTRAASDTTALVAIAGDIGASRTVFVTGLTPGVNTFTAMYKSFDGTSVIYGQRDLIVIAFG